MAMRPCPNCDTQSVRWLEVSSSAASVDYYRCEACGHVWHVRKGEPDGPTTAVTVSPHGVRDRFRTLHTPG